MYVLVAAYIDIRIQPVINPRAIEVLRQCYTLYLSLWKVFCGQECCLMISLEFSEIYGFFLYIFLFIKLDESFSLIVIAQSDRGIDHAEYSKNILVCIFLS